jgi:hypothetical protein
VKNLETLTAGHVAQICFQSLLLHGPYDAAVAQELRQFVVHICCYRRAGHVFSSIASRGGPPCPSDRPVTFAPSAANARRFTFIESVEQALAVGLVSKLVGRGSPHTAACCRKSRQRLP